VGFKWLKLVANGFIKDLVNTLKIKEIRMFQERSLKAPSFWAIKSGRDI
jgi:hypothetical protein